MLLFLYFIFVFIVLATIASLLEWDFDLWTELMIFMISVVFYTILAILAVTVGLTIAGVMMVVSKEARKSFLATFKKKG